MTCALACSGVPIIGVEADVRRQAAAMKLRSAVMETWPAVRYDIVTGFYPDCLTDKFFGRDAVLVFTNVAAGWDDAAFERVIGSMARFSEAFLDLGLFGAEREEESECQALFERIVQGARFGERLPASIVPNALMARFVF